MATTDLGPLDRGLYALFSRHADRPRHDRDRDRYRAANLRISFDRYLARVYGFSWIVGTTTACSTGLLVLLLPAGVVAAVADFLHAGAPGLARVSLPSLPRPAAAAGAGLLLGLLSKRTTVSAGGIYLRWVASARRTAIERTLPGAVRYLRALATGSDDRRTMLRKVAERDAYGETGDAFRAVLNRASLAGSLDTALREAARDTPSRDLLSPFLLKFREHASRGSDALESYLRLESRMLSHRQARQRQRASDFLELLAELFIVLLVLPALLVIILTVLSVLAPGLSATAGTPLGRVTVRAVLVYGAAVFALVVGVAAALLVDHLRPPDQAPPTYERPGGLATLATVPTNPASAAAVLLAPAAAVGLGLGWLGYRPADAILLGYVAYGLPVGAVAARRARRDDAKDREVKDFVHAVAGHMSLGRPFPKAVEVVARETHCGPLQSDVDDLAFSLGVTTHEGDVRTAALERFTEQVGTPLARQTMGLVTGALDVGGDTEEVFETLQSEVGRLYHQRKSLRSAMMVYVAVGWTTALLIVGIMLAVNGNVLAGFSQLSAVSETSASVAIDPNAIDLARDRWRFYLVTQATMLACGWFAGVASRDGYEALLHSAALVAVCHVVFAGTGMI